MWSDSFGGVLCEHSESGHSIFCRSGLPCCCLWSLPCPGLPASVRFRCHQSSGLKYPSCNPYTTSPLSHVALRPFTLCLHTRCRTEYCQSHHEGRQQKCGMGLVPTLEGTFIICLMGYPLTDVLCHHSPRWQIFNYSRSVHWVSIIFLHSLLERHFLGNRASSMNAGWCVVWLWHPLIHSCVWLKPCTIPCPPIHSLACLLRLLKSSFHPPIFAFIHTSLPSICKHRGRHSMEVPYNKILHWQAAFLAHQGESMAESRSWST